jgi:predicted Rossmann fold nucleotide-binding protein DprA/Smf involved in DNA uptake
MERGEDYLARQLDWHGKPYVFTVEEENWPQWLKDNKEKYTYLCK